MAKKDLQIPVVERIKKELGVTENYDNFTLHKLLVRQEITATPTNF